MKFLSKVLYIPGAFLILLGFWQLLVMFGGHAPALLPTPLDVLDALIHLTASGELFEHVGISLYRFLVGYTASIVTGLTLGLIIGQVDFLSKLVDPLIQLLRPVAPVAWMPFIILFLGIGDAPAIVVIFMAAFSPILLSTISASKKIDQNYLKIAKTFEIKQPQLFFKIILPAIFPYIANGMHLGLGMAWIFLVAGEMIGVRSGLGFLIMDARNNMQPEVLLATICVIAVLGLLLDKIITLFERQINKYWGIKTK